MVSDVDRLPWDRFIAERFRWEQGEHVTLIGPTGMGKTTLALAIVEARAYVLALATKPKDATMDKLVRRRTWRLVKRWDRMPRVLRGPTRIVFWPVYRTPDDEPAQAVQIAQAMRGTFTQGGWCVMVDELWYLEKKLGLSRLVETFYTQGRSIGLSVLAGTQRPAHVTLLAYDQATHLFLWGDSDERNLKRIGGLNGLKSQTVRDIVASLPPHDVLYCNLRTRDMVITRAPKP